MNVARQKYGRRGLGLLVLVVLIAAGVQADTNTALPPPALPADTESLRAYLALQEQVRTTQLSLEKNRQETEAIAARSATALADQIKTLTETLSQQRTREVEAMQSTNRLLLVVVGAFACLGFIAMLLTSWLQMRALNRLTEFSAGLSMRPSLGGLIPGGSLISNAAAAQANTQLFGALDRIERRMQDLEQAGAPAARPVPPETATPAADTVAAAPAAESKAINGAREANGAGVSPDQISLWLAKGQSLLNLEHAADAMACFDSILELNPNHAEALVKKGAALELLRRDEEALRCYDRAIEADDSLTIAYLQKGGLFNRLERYEEALTCYERALQTQDRPKAAAA